MKRAIFFMFAFLPTVVLGATPYYYVETQNGSRWEVLSQHTRRDDAELQQERFRGDFPDTRVRRVSNPDDPSLIPHVPKRNTGKTQRQIQWDQMKNNAPPWARFLAKELGLE